MIGARLSHGRLHLQHGPIDLVLGVKGARQAAFDAAAVRFKTILEELVAELPLLRSPMPVAPLGIVARRMAHAATGYREFVTPMAAVAGAVADEILATMRRVDGVRRAYVNNGGDIALWLKDGSFDVGIAGLNASALGKVRICAGDGIGGIATSGRNGRSFSLGIADSVTVLAGSAAEADVAATLVANAVDVDAECVVRARAVDLDPDSDLGTRLVASECGTLTARDAKTALNNGMARAQTLISEGRIMAVHLVLQGRSRTAAVKELTDA